MSSVLRVSAIAAAVFGLLAAIAGCASKGVPYATPSTSAPATQAAPSAAPAPTVSMSALPAAAGQLTGTQLESVLLPASYFPAGFSLASSGAVNSGGSLSTSPAQYDLATVSCATFVNHLGDTGFGETAMASNSYAGSDQAYDQLVYQFASASAADGFVAGIKALAGRCHAFTATDDGETGTFSLTAADAAAVAGHPSLELSENGTISGSSVVLDTLFTASGVDVFAGAVAGVGLGAPSGVATQTIVYDLMKRQQAAAVLN